MIKPTSPPPPYARPTQSPVTDSIVGDGAISLATDTSFLEQSTPKNTEDESEAYAVTIASGAYKRQTKQVFVPASIGEDTALFRLTGTFADCVALLFNDVGQSAVLVWDGGAWHVVGGNAVKEYQ